MQYIFFCYISIINGIFLEIYENKKLYTNRFVGQPLLIGIFADATFDVGRIENVHFNSYYCNNDVYMIPQMLYGRAFVFGRNDWEYVFNTFAINYAIGYHFYESTNGVTNGNFLGIGMDGAANASVQIDQASGEGLLFTNCELTAFNTHLVKNMSSTPVQIVINEHNISPVIFNNCAFWGPSNNIASLHSDSTTIFVNNRFSEWDDFRKDGASCIYANNGNVVINGNYFGTTKKQLTAEKGTKKVIFTNNILDGSVLNLTIGEQVQSSIANNL